MIPVAFLRVRRTPVEVRGRTVELEWVDFPDVAAVLPVLADGRLVLVEQYRAPVNRPCLEVPAGAADPGEDPEAAARRELAEETGYRAGHLRFLAAYYPAIGYSSERIFIYVATDLEPGPTSFDPGEEIVTRAVTPAEMEELIRAGAVADSKSLLAYFLWRREQDGAPLPAGLPPPPGR